MHKQKDFCLQKWKVQKGTHTAGLSQEGVIPTILSNHIFIATPPVFHFRVLRDSSGGQHLCVYSTDIYTKTSVIGYPTRKHSKILLSKNPASCSVGWSLLWKSRSVSILQQYYCPIRRSWEHIAQLMGRRGPGKVQGMLQPEGEEHCGGWRGAAGALATRLWSCRRAPSRWNKNGSVPEQARDASFRAETRY